MALPRKRILFLSQRVPYPPNRGDKIATWRVVERLHRHHEVTCVAFSHDAEDIKAAQDLRSFGLRVITFPYSHRRATLKSLPHLLGSQPLTLVFYGSRDLQRAVDELIPNVDLAYAYSTQMAAFLLPHSGVRRVLHISELDSDKWRQYAAFSRGPKRWIYAREARTLLAVERRLAHSADENILCTPLEQQQFMREFPGAPSTVIRNGVDLDFFRAPGTRPDSQDLVFTGVMNYYPNVDGCTFFAREVLPRIRQRFPAAAFTIVGSKPTSDVVRLQELPGVRVTGFVPDTRDYLARAAISVAPLRIARGIQNKVLEAMAMGLPVVGTTAATQGVGGTPERDYVVADQPSDMARRICRLLDSPLESFNLGNRARRFVEQHCNWDTCLDELDRILEQDAPALTHV